MRLAAVAVVLLLAGCSAPPPEPELPYMLMNRGELPTDIAAPPPTEQFEEFEPIEIQENGIRGVVQGPGAELIEGARVWLEEVDLRAPVNNAAQYRTLRQATTTTTDARGAFFIPADGEAFFVAATAPGYLITRATPGNESVMHLATPDVSVIAHRGASFYAPENTLAAMEKAALLGAKFVEVDVRLSRDGQLVLLHDAELDRTTNGTGHARNYTADELTRLDAGAAFHESFQGEPIVSLETALAFADRLGVTLLVDIKATPEDAAAAREAAVATVPPGSRHWLVAFRNATVEYCSQQAVSRCGWISKGYDPVSWLVENGAFNGAHGLLLNQAWVEPAVVAHAHQLGLDLFAWTVNDEDGWSRLRSAGVDGIITDRPGYLLAAMTGSPN